MSEVLDDMKISALAPWYGGNRDDDAVGAELGRLGWVGVPFACGMPELEKIRAAAGVANDRHRHVINLARVIKNPGLKERMLEIVGGVLFHPDEFAAAQQRCIERERAWETAGGLFGGLPLPTLDDAQWAADYYVCCWMGRGGSAGQAWEFRQSIATRFTATGGGSAKRWRSAVESVEAWSRVLHRWEFTCLDAFAFLDCVPDRENQGLYLDPPWPEAGDQYKHMFTEDDQRRLARKLATFENVRIVVRFGDHPLIRKLYPSPRWTWVERESRNQEGNTINEALIINGPSYTENPAQ